MRRSLGQKLRLRHTPELTFTYDEGLEAHDRIARLLAEVHAADARPRPRPPRPKTKRNSLPSAERATHGVMVVDKPAGPTSHDVVDRVRRALGIRKAGHTGTLDPFATGVLPVCIGKATRLARFLTGTDKTYRATMRLGFATTTDDLRPVRAPASTPAEALQRACRRSTGPLHAGGPRVLREVGAGPPRLRPRPGGDRDAAAGVVDHRARAHRARPRGRSGRDRGALLTVRRSATGGRRCPAPRRGRGPARGRRCRPSSAPRSRRGRLRGRARRGRAR